MSWLVDTNIWSEVKKPQPNPRVLAWLVRHESRLRTSAIVIAELAAGIRCLPRSRRRAELDAWLEGMIDRMESNILRFDVRVALAWADLQARSFARPLSLRDSLIAAPALRHNLTIVTRNVRDFPAPLPTLDPFTS